MMRMLRAALVACLAFFLAGIALPVHAEDWQAVVDAAKKEGKVVIYDMALGAPYFLAVLKSFEAKYGIQVESLDLRASELAERIRTEQSAGRYLGDVEMITTTMIEEQRNNGDFVEKLPAIPNAANLRPPFKATDYSVTAFVQPMGILINTRLVKEEDVPKSWGDLTDPKWKGKILSDDMRPLGSGNTMFAILEHGGRDHLDIAEIASGRLLGADALGELAGAQVEAFDWYAIFGLEGFQHGEEVRRAECHVVDDDLTFLLGGINDGMPVVTRMRRQRDAGKKESKAGDQSSPQHSHHHLTLPSILFLFARPDQTSTTTYCFSTETEKVSALSGPSPSASPGSTLVS